MKFFRVIYSEIYRVIHTSAVVRSLADHWIHCHIALNSLVVSFLIVTLYGDFIYLLDLLIPDYIE